jgi:hypothetical protein
MDSTQIPQEILNIEDIRQCTAWLEYLKVFGWKNASTTNGVKLAFMQMPLGKFAKIQRAHNITRADINEIQEMARKFKFSFIKVEPSLSQQLGELDENGFRVSKGFMSPPSTLFIDLQQKENDIWNSFSHSAKYSVNRAVREGARVEKFIKPNVEILSKFYNLVESTKSKKKFTTISFEHLVKKTEIFGDGAVLFLVFSKDGRIDGGKYFASHKNNVWYLYGGTSEEGRHNKSGYNLVWESFLGLKRIGYKWLDFEGTDDPRLKYTEAWGGFAHFKEKFGGIRVEFPFPRIKYYSRVFDIMSRITRFEV